MENKTEDGVLLSQYQSVYQKNGQKIKETEVIRGAGGTTEKRESDYAYDRLGRLTKESHTGAQDISYSYDAHNNRKEMKTDSYITAYRYNKNDELQRVDILDRKTEIDSVTLYRYDENGNQLATVNRRKIEKGKEGPQFDLNVTLGQNRLNDNVVNHYNALNEHSRTLTRNYKVSYTYDDEGLRTSKSVNGVKRTYVWDGDQLVLELDAAGEVKKRYIRGQNLAFTDAGEGTPKQFYVQDSHGSVVQLINEDGSIARKYTKAAIINQTYAETIELADVRPRIQRESSRSYKIAYISKDEEILKKNREKAAI